MDKLPNKVLNQK